MSLKVDMSEVHSLKEAINSDLNTIDSKVSTLSSSMSKLIGADGFEGEAASSIKNYTNTFHIKTISKIKTINENFKKDIEKSIEKFESEVDNSKSAILVDSQIKEYKKNIDDALLDVNKAVHKAGVAISAVSDLTTAQKIDSTNLSAKMATFNHHIDRTLEKLNDFDSNNSIDGDRTDNLISELKGLNSYVKNLPSNRARIKSTSSKVENAIVRHKTGEEIIRWQKYMEAMSDNIYRTPGLDKKSYEAMKKAGQEYFAVKAIGNGSFRKGFNEYKNTRDINKLINNLDKKRLNQVATMLNTDRGNANVKNLYKTAGQFVKNNPFKSGNFTNWVTNAQDYKSENAKVLRKMLTDENFKYKFGDAKKFLDGKEIRKAGLKEFKNTFISESFRETMLKKENLKSKSAIEKNIKKYLKDNVTDGIKEFKNKNILGKLGKLLKLGGKALKPLAVIYAVTDNLDKKTKQEKLVGMGVDLGSVGVSAAAGAAAGSCIPLPVVGTLVGAGVGILAGIYLDSKGQGADKSIKENAEETINKSIDKGQEVVKNSWKGITSGFKSVF